MAATVAITARDGQQHQQSSSFKQTTTNAIQNNITI